METTAGGDGKQAFILQQQTISQHTQNPLLLLVLKVL